MSQFCPPMSNWSRWTIIALAIAAACMSGDSDATETAFQGMKVEVIGEGRPLVMIPGLNSSAEVWRETCQALQPGVQCHIPQLPGPMHLGPPVRAGGPMGHLHLDLLHPVALAQQVDRQRRLHAEPVRQRPGGLEGVSGDAALAVERLNGLEAGGSADAVPGQADDQAVAAQPDAGDEDRDGHVGRAGTHRLDERSRGSRGLAQIGVQEE